MDTTVHVLKRVNKSGLQNLCNLDYLLWHGRVESFLKRLPKEPVFDLTKRPTKWVVLKRLSSGPAAE